MRRSVHLGMLDEQLPIRPIILRARDVGTSAQLESFRATGALQLGWQRSHDQHSA